MNSSQRGFHLLLSIHPGKLTSQRCLVKIFSIIHNYQVQYYTIKKTKRITRVIPSSLIFYVPLPPHPDLTIGRSESEALALIHQKDCQQYLPNSYQTINLDIFIIA